MEGVSIPPMILILFVENCFKHGLKDNIDQVRIDIALKLKNSCLFFSIKIRFRRVWRRPAFRGSG